MAAPAVDPDALTGDEVDRRSATKGGREVVTLRCVEAGGTFVIECDVYPVDGLRVEPLRPGPYRFGTRQEADAFVEEAVKALTYLGCDVS
jgi:hypothetical protein